MPIPAVVKRIEPWAESGDRETPESRGLSRADGWPVQYEQVGGTPPERTIFNQLFYELTHFVVEVRMRGLPLPWDARVNYESPAFVALGGKIYRSRLDTGPGTGNAAEPGSPAAADIWEEY